MDSTGKVVLGVLAGAAVGALVGVLFAPDKGTETRKKIAESSTDLMDEWKEKFDDLIAGLNEKVQPVKDNAKEWAEKGKSKIEEVKSDVKSATGGKYSPTV
ncbi:MAG: YtxH domain-containing protein [Bacteroidota bacterium]